MMENNEWICKFEEIVFGDGHWWDGFDGMCKDLQTKLTASDGKHNDVFGYQLSISDNVLVVGGYNSEVKLLMYLKRMMITAGHKQPSSLRRDGASDDRFGSSVDIYGDIIIVGAQLHNTTGAAYIYSRQDGGNWTQTAKITASGGSYRSQFEYTVSASEDLVIVSTCKWWCFWTQC
jgi:hypothetical protein